MSDRRSQLRPEATDRRSFPRPPLWLNLALVVLAAATFLYAKQHRGRVVERTAALFKPTPNSPAELNRIREELASMDLTREQLAKELEGRMEYLRSLEGEQFYISIDTQQRKMQFRLGRDIVRETSVTIGEPKTNIRSGKQSWSFPTLKGGFNVTGKETGMDWRVPEWLYAMNGQPVPAERPTADDGLGKYVIFLPNNYVIHSPPPADSPLKGAKPGSFMVPEEDLAAIWPRVTNNTRVYIF